MRTEKLNLFIQKSCNAIAIKIYIKYIKIINKINHISLSQANKYSPKKNYITAEEKEELSAFVKGKPEDENPIQVYIGNESPVSSMRDCSVVTATYELGDGMRGTIGIVGPKRMDYDKVVGTVKNMMKQLDSLYKKG